MQGRDARRRAVLVWSVVCVSSVALVAALSVGLATVMGNGPGADDSYDSVSAVFAGLALLGIVATARLQLRELSMQRAELSLQRADIHRTSQASMRALHLELLKLGIADESLARVWPDFADDLPHQRIRQYMYANLILSHHLLAMDSDAYTEEDVMRQLDALFSSPLMREFWSATQDFRRRVLPPGGTEWEFAEKINTMLAAPGGDPEGGSTTAA